MVEPNKFKKIDSNEIDELSAKYSMKLISKNELEGIFNYMYNVFSEYDKIVTNPSISITGNIEFDINREHSKFKYQFVILSNNDNLYLVSIYTKKFGVNTPKGKFLCNKISGVCNLLEYIINNYNYLQ